MTPLLSSLRAFSVVVLLLAGGRAITSAVSAAEMPRERISLDKSWRFAFGHSDPRLDFEHGTGYFSYLAKAGFADGPAAGDFDDRAWRVLDLPHDWAVEALFSRVGSFSHGFKAVGGKFVDANIGWYRKSFRIEEADFGRRVSVIFDGAYRDARVWINGFYLGREPSGYSEARYDLTDYLNFGGENTLAVRVDATIEEGWFYEGAGIYRHVWIEKNSPVHIAAHSTFITAQVKTRVADLTARTTVVNDGATTTELTIEQRIIDPSAKTLASVDSESFVLEPGRTREVVSALQVGEARLWSLEDPALHRLITIVRTKAGVADEVQSSFGIRTLRFDPNEGFFLNGKHVVLKGTNNHQDHAGLGVALPDSMQDYRVARLKEMGDNAYRCSHHPPTPELLDACDRLGMLVIDENRLMGPSPEQLSQLERMIKRDRTHPSVILWSLGNEEWRIEGNIQGARIAASMQAFAQRLDPTRRTTVAISGGWGQGISSVIDVMGYNYISHGSTDRQHTQFPQQPGVGTEETTTQGTRGVFSDDRPRGWLAPLVEGTSGGNAELGWKHYAARPYLAGLFYWTGFDYRGEEAPLGWPAISSQFGILDTCGFPKDSFYYIKAWWTEQPALHISPHWNWPGKEGQPIGVRVDSNAEEVELFLNQQSLGRKSMERNGHLEWEVNYEPGLLIARGFNAGREVATERVESTGEPVALKLTADPTNVAGEKAGFYIATVTAVDAKGRAVPTANIQVSFSLRGSGKILAAGNGDPGSHEVDRFSERMQLWLIEPWRVRTLEKAGRSEILSEVSSAIDDSGWTSFERDPWFKETSAPSLTVIRGHFTISAMDAAVQTWRLFPGIFGAEQVLYLNGVLLPGVGADGAVPVAASQLHAGDNVVAVITTPFPRAEKNPLKKLRTTLQAVTPAAPSQRKLFNGLAQVMVQGSLDSSVSLSASAAGLAPSELRLSASKEKP